MTINTAGVANAAPQGVYQTTRSAWNFSYSFPGLTPGATYTVRLHFADFWVGVVGGRLFNVTINGVAALTKCRRLRLRRRTIDRAVGA